MEAYMNTVRDVALNTINIRQLHKSTVNLAKRMRGVNNTVLCFGVGMILMGTLIDENRRRIKLLEKQNKDLAREVEELKNQKGA